MSTGQCVRARSLRSEVVWIDAVVNFAFMVKLKMFGDRTNEVLVGEAMSDDGFTVKPELAVRRSKTLFTRRASSAVPEPTTRNIIRNHVIEEPVDRLLCHFENHVGSVLATATPACRRNFARSRGSD